MVAKGLQGSPSAKRVNHPTDRDQHNETQVRTLELVRRVVEGPEALEFRRCEDDQGRYTWIELVPRRFDYRQLSRQDRRLVLAYMQRLSGYSRAQLTRLVSRWMTGKRLLKAYNAPEHAFARRYTTLDVAFFRRGHKG